MKISVIGLGYVGLPTAILFAESGHEVYGVDINEELVNNIKQGKHNFEDDQIRLIYKKLIGKKNFSVSSKVNKSDVFIVAVPTPVKDKRISLEYVKLACLSVVKVLKKGDMVIIESTISPGTTEGTVKNELEKSGLKAGLDFSLAHIPERVLPGNIYKELIFNDRVIGGIDFQSSKKARDLYTSFVKGQIIETDAKTAETAKITENTFRDVNIAYANEVMVLCEKIGVNPWEVIQIANNHPRINILKPGPGVGGHCIPVDPWFLIEQDMEESLLLQCARSRNDKMPIKVSEDIIRILEVIKGKKVSLLGCTYKADSSDARETPTEVIVHCLSIKGIVHSAYDPHLLKKWSCSTPNLKECVKGTDLIVLIVPHKQLLDIDPQELLELTDCKTILDCTNSYDTDLWEKSGFKVVKLGMVEKLIDLGKLKSTVKAIV